MSELIFALKTFLISALLISLMQVKIAGSTLENHTQLWLENSSVAHFIQGAATGGILACRDLYKSIATTWQGPSQKINVKAAR